MNATRHCRYYINTHKTSTYGLYKFYHKKSSDNKIKQLAIKLIMIITNVYTERMHNS